MNRIILQKGFTLIELAIVLFIAGLILVGVLTPLSTQIEQKERQNIQDVLNDIEQALYGFTVANGRLPCPDCRDNTGSCAGLAASKINDGEEDDGVTPGTAPPGPSCATVDGNVPWVDLGVPELDNWGRRFIYRIDPEFADPADGTTDTATCTEAATLNVSFELCADGALTILDRGSTCPGTAPGGNTVATGVPAVVISQGKKQVAEEPISCYEQENTDGDTTLVYRDYSRHEGADPTDPTDNYFFDDLLIWISPNILKNRMVVTERLP